jgi:periplasmic protein TonB
MLSPMPPRTLFALAIAATLLAGCETAPQRLTLQPVETASHLVLPARKPIETAPELIAQQPPLYPRELRAAGIQGEVRIEMIVGADGSVTDAVALKATDIRFANAAIACVRKWKFQPAKSGGEPVASRLQVPIVFALDNQSQLQAPP